MKKSLTLSANGTVIAHKVENLKIYRPKGLQTTTSAKHVGHIVRVKKSLTLSVNGTVIADNVENLKIYRAKGLQTTTSAKNVGQDVRMKESLTLSANGTVIAHKVENLKICQRNEMMTIEKTVCNHARMRNPAVLLSVMIIVNVKTNTQQREIYNGRKLCVTNATLPSFLNMLQFFCLLFPLFKVFASPISRKASDHLSVPKYIRTLNC